MYLVKMVSRIKYLLILAVMASISLCAELPWLHDYSTAQERVAASGRPLIMFFTGSDWCGYCARLEDQILETPAFIEAVKGKYEWLRVDFPRHIPQDAALKQFNEELRTRYRVQGVPLLLILDQDGKVLGRLGYELLSPEAYASRLDEITVAEPS